MFHINCNTTETPTIQGFVGAVLKGEVIGEKTSSKKTVYFTSDEVKLKLLSKNENNTFAYSTTQDGDKTQMDGNTLDITATINGTTYYFYVVDGRGSYSKYYTAITAKLVSMQDKTIYVGEGQTVDIGNIEGENLGNISYSETEDNTIATISEDKVTGIKAGNTTSIITETNAGQTSTLTIKVVKMGLAKTEETTLLGVNKTVEITGTNYGTLSTQVEDSTIATANISGNNLTVVPKKEGNTTITVTENNARVTETYKIKVASVALSPESGIYTMPTEGQATIKTQVTAVNAEKIEYAWSDDIEDWKEIENNEIATKTNATAGTYYLLVRINGEATYKSKEFVVGANTEQSNKITITIDKEGWTNKDITATINYGSTLTQNKKAGYGTTLEGAKSAASTSTATSVPVTANGYVYAEATDIAGNKITASLQISNIDKTLPIIGSVEGSAATGNTGTVTVSNIADTGGSGLKGIYISTSSTTPTATSVTWTPNTASTYTKTVSANGTYNVWVLDNAGNVSAVKSCTVSGIVAKVTGVTLTNAIVKKGETVTIAKTLSGSTSYKTIAFTSSTTAKVTIVSETGVATGVATGTSTITCTVTNYDGTTVSGTCTLTVVDLSYSPNGGSYALPYTGDTAGTATIKSTVTIGGATTSYYAWNKSNTTAPTDWTKYSAATGGTLSTTSTTAATYYLWNKVTDASGNYVTYVSNNFTITANKITITPSTTAWTNENITCTIAYPSETTSTTRKAAYGSTLTAATTASSSATAPTTSVTVSENGYVYAEATDAAGNKVTASLQVTNIDKTAPSLSISTTTTTRSITVTATAQDSLSGISGYRFSKDNGNTWTAYQTSSTYTFDDLYGNVAGTSHNITVQVKDKIENTNTVSKIVSTSKNTTYYTQTANDLLCTIGGRNWYKSNDTDAIAGVLYRKGTAGDWTCPILVSTSIEGVKYYTTHDYSVQTDDIGTVVYGGVTYYYSSSGQSMPDASYTSKYKMLNSTSTRYTSMEQAAQELLRLYYNNTYPSLSISSTNSTTKSITVVANAQQNGREIVGYRFSKDNGFTWTSYQTSGTYTFNSLYGNLGGTSYNIKVQVKDSIGDTNTVTNTVSTSKNTTYYTQTADDLLCTIGGRGFYKYDSTGAIAGIAYMKTDSGNWTCPILVSTSIEGVKYYTTYDYSIMTEGISTVSYGGVTYYYSSDGQWVHNEEYTSKYKMLNTASSRYSSVAQAAQVLLELYYGD